MVRVSVGIIDHHPLMLESISGLLSACDRFDIVGTGVAAADIDKIIGAHHPSILIVDLSVPGNVFKAILDASLSAPETRIIIFTAVDSADQAVQALAARARGYVLKTSPGSDLIDAIDATFRNEIYVSPSLAVRMIGAMQIRATAAKERLRVKFSARENQIIKLLMQGKKNSEISLALDVTEKTVKFNMTNIMLKLNARNRVEVIIAIRKLGLFI